MRAHAPVAFGAAVGDLHNLAAIHVAEGDHTAARRLLEEALAISASLDYAALSRLAEGVVSYNSESVPSNSPVVLVTERDYAQALGQTIKGYAPALPLVAIDQIGLGEGDLRCGPQVPEDEEALHALWDADILNVLSGDMKPVEFRKLIKPEHELNFVRFLSHYGWRLRGSDLDVLKELVRHYMPHVARQLQHKEAGVRAWAEAACRRRDCPGKTPRPSRPISATCVAPSPGRAPRLPPRTRRTTPRRGRGNPQLSDQIDRWPQPKRTSTSPRSGTRGSGTG